MAGIPQSPPGRCGGRRAVPTITRRNAPGDAMSKYAPNIDLDAITAIDVLIALGLTDQTMRAKQVARAQDEARRS